MSISRRIIFTVFFIVGMMLQTVAQNPSCKVYKPEGNKYYFGKLYIPQGSGKFKLKHTQKTDDVVELYYGHIDRNKIYMMSMVITEDCYYVDATACSHAFVVRTTLPDDVVMVPATAEDDAIIDANDSFYFNKALSFQNKLRFTTEMVANNVLQENNPYKNKNIYFMVNPARYGFGFAWIDQFGSTRNLPANSLYILGTKTSSAPDLEIIWPDYDLESTTVIKSVKNSEIANDAIFTLQGQRVTNMVKGHIYIQNGRKFVAQ